MATWRVGGAVPVDLALLDTLARLGVALDDLGCTLRLQGVCGDLAGLLELTGLDDALARLGVEAVGQPEGREDVGVDEVVEPRDLLS